MRKIISARRLFKLIEHTNELYKLRGEGDPVGATLFIDDRRVGFFTKWEDFKKYAKEELYNYEAVINRAVWVTQADRTAEFVYHYVVLGHSNPPSILRLSLS